MSKKEKLIARILTYPKDFTYDEMRTLLGLLGFEERSNGKTSGLLQGARNRTGETLQWQTEPSDVV